VLGINPFDQPNVQEAKDNTQAVLAATRRERGAADAGDELRALLDGLAPPPTSRSWATAPATDVDAAVTRAARGAARRHAWRPPFGYGPRYLHSTGQFHKGGPRRGRFLSSVHDPRQDADVPGEPFTFAHAHRAQADGDLQTLRGHGLPAERCAAATTGGRADAHAIKEML
jgi:glucose-6-phosphate isomerase/transaldolase/glucose-6-phosphate isomerase